MPDGLPASAGAVAVETEPQQPDGLSERHLEILRLVEKRPERTQREIASSLGISLGAANFCLRALVEKGLVKVRNFRASDNKLRYAYVLTPRGLSAKIDMTRAFLKRKLDEYETLRGEIETLQQELGNTREDGTTR